jgi:hypothetical protein
VLLILFVIVVAAIVTDSLVTVAALSRINHMQQAQCDLHQRVRAWELAASAALHIHEPLLQPTCP